MIPFLGTALGSACVFFMKKSLGDLVQRSLAGFAAGVMVAASIWSLLIPAIEQSEGMGLSLIHILSLHLSYAAYTSSPARKRRSPCRRMHCERKLKSRTGIVAFLRCV